MVGQRRPPCVQHRGDADAGAEVPGVGGDRQHRLGRRLEQQVVEQRPFDKFRTGLLWNVISATSAGSVNTTWKYPTGSRSASRSASQARGGTLAPGAMPVAAAVIDDPPMPAAGAGLDVTAHDGGAAMLDRRHDLELMQPQMPGMRGPVGRPCAAEDVGDLDGGAHAGSTGGRLPLHQRHQPVERTGHGMDRACRDLGLERGRLELAVPEQHPGLRRGRLWITRMSTSCSSRWVAKLCRNVCGLTRLRIPAASARRQHDCADDRCRANQKRRLSVPKTCLGEPACRVLLSDAAVLKNWPDPSAAMYFSWVRFTAFTWISTPANMLSAGKR